MPSREPLERGGALRSAFDLPSELEAHEPPESRGSSREDVRLLVTDAEHVARHARFDALPDFLSPGDLVVLNDSKTYPAALTAVRESGESIALHFAHLDPSTDKGGGDAAPMTAFGGLVLAAFPGGVLAAGEHAALPGGGRAWFLGLHRGSRRMWITRLHLPLPYFEYFERYGRPIAYAHVTKTLPLAAFQTAYARALGSSEMPSAGRPFTARMIDRLLARGVEIATVTLHAGVSSAERDELPLEEWREVPLECAVAVRRALRRGSRVVAVGTTVLRALESSLDRHRRIVSSRGWTALHITPDRPVRIVSGLLTGLHEPTSTHLAILESIAGREHVEHAYNAALANRYLWHEFGDSHLIIPGRRPEGCAVSV
jgi:S-adenosylmethionine:tRNA ribosyltransferase-isomerase